MRFTKKEGEKRGVLGWEVAYISNSEQYNTLERSTEVQFYINTHPLILFLYHNTAPPISNTSSISKTNGITIEAVPNRNRCYYNKYYKDFGEYSCRIQKWTYGHWIQHLHWEQDSHSDDPPIPEDIYMKTQRNWRMKWQAIMWSPHQAF